MAKKSVGFINLKYHGEVSKCELFDDGTVVLPDGATKRLSNEQFQSALQKLKALAPVTPNPYALPQGNSGAQTYVPDDAQSMHAFEKYDTETAERKLHRKRRTKVLLGILFALIILAAAGVFVYFKFPELIGLAPNSYRVAVANRDISAGDTITDADVGYIELTRDEYTAQCVNSYMAEDGSMKTDAPIFFMNAQNEIYGRYANENIQQGSILKGSMVTTSKFVGEVTVGGETQQTEMTQGQMDGITTVVIVAKITTEDGKTQEVTLSSMKLRGRELADFVDSVGESVLPD